MNLVLRFHIPFSRRSLSLLDFAGLCNATETTHDTTFGVSSQWKTVCSETFDSPDAGKSLFIQPETASGRKKNWMPVHYIVSVLFILMLVKLHLFNYSTPRFLDISACEGVAILASDYSKTQFARYRFAISVCLNYISRQPCNKLNLMTCL